MSDYIILDSSTAIDITGGFNRTFSGTGSKSNPSLTKTNNYYQWKASFNNDWNAPRCLDTPVIFINNPTLLSKYRQIQITYYRTQYSRRAYNKQGIDCHFDTGDLVFDSFVTQAGTTTESKTVIVDIPKGAKSIKFCVAANNDDTSSNTTCQVKQIILKGKKGCKLGDIDCEVYLGSIPIDSIYLGGTEL